MIFDRLGPHWLARLESVLARREPLILSRLIADEPLSPTERLRIDHALMDESVELMTADWGYTTESEDLRSLSSALNRIAPYEVLPAPGEGNWDRSQPIDHSDPYGDGGASAGYGPRPGTPGRIPVDEMPPVLHPVPDDYDIPEDPSVAILGPRRPDEPPLRRYPLERPDAPAEGPTP